jgi:hypothetical protein
MSSWVSVWTPLSFAFSWAALNLVSEALGLCGGFLGGSGGGFTAVTLIGSGGFLTGSGPGFTGLALVGCGSGDGRGFAYAAWSAREQPPSERQTARTASAMMTRITQPRSSVPPQWLRGLVNDDSLLFDCGGDE